MNPHTFAQRDCANYQTKDGSCTGIQMECLGEPGEPTRAKPLERCLLAGKTLRPCRYLPATADEKKLAAPQLSGF